MNRFPNILGEILNIEEEDNDDLDMLYAATRKSKGFSQGRIRRHRGSVLGHRMVNRDQGQKNRRNWSIFRRKIGFRWAWKRFCSGKIGKKKSAKNRRFFR